MPTDKIGARLGYIYGESTRPFINAFKQARPWSAGNTGWDALVAAGHMTAGGQLNRIPPGSNGFGTRVLGAMPAQAGGTGRWRLRWEGTATWEVYAANVVRVSANEIQFDFNANGSNWVDMAVRTIGSQVRNISLVHEGDWADADAGRIFRRQYLDEVRDYSSFRFDEWVGILNTVQQGGLRVTTWESRALPTDEMFYRFVPYEWMIALSNELGREPWVCMPTAATDDHFRQCAELFRDRVPAPRRVHVEYSTKTWDWAGTEQAHYCGRMAREQYGSNAGTGFRDWYGMRSTQMALIWKDVWDNDPRLNTIVQHQADWVGAEADILEAPIWRSLAGTRGLPAYVAPHSVLDTLTVHAQVDGGMAYGGAVAQIDNWRTTLSQTEAFNRMRDQMLRAQYFYDNTDTRDVDNLKTKWVHYRRVTNGYGMKLASYEVGNHLNGVGGSDATRAFIHAFAVSPQMGEVYAGTFSALLETGFDGPLAMSLECRIHDQNVVSGLQRWLGDRNPAWQAVHALIEDTPVVVVPPVVTPPIVVPPVVVPPIVVPPVVDPQPPVIVPEPEPEPEPTPAPEDTDMPTRKLLAEILSGLNAIAEAIESHLDAAPATPDPVTPPVQPPVTPPVTPEPPVTPAPAGMRKPAEITRMSANWSRGNMALPDWSDWAPSLVQMNADGSATLSTRIIGGAFKSGLMQIFLPTFTFGKVGTIAAITSPNGVAAFFTYADNDKTECDFELVRRPGGSLAWALGLHMFVNGQRRNPVASIHVPVTVAELAQEHHYEIDYQDGFVAFYIDGKEVGRYTQADLPTGTPWSTSAKFDTFIGTYRHTGWSGFNAADYAAPTTQMLVKGIQVPGL